MQNEDTEKIQLTVKAIEQFQILDLMENLSFPVSTATSHTNRSVILDIRNNIERDPQCFYFRCSSVTYFRNLISLNPLLNIDDLIYENISNLHILKDKGNIRSDKEVISLLKIFHQLLKHKVFSRTVLRHIFNNIVYSDFSDNFIKYSILSEILKQYKESEVLSTQYKENEILHTKENELLHTKENELLHTKENEILKNTNTQIQDSQYFSQYTRLDISHIVNQAIDASKDNVCVLANIIWENTFYIVKSFDGTHCHEEVNSIIKLYACAISVTGRFYERRMLDLVPFFNKIEECPAFKDLKEAILENFENFEIISKIKENE